MGKDHFPIVSCHLSFAIADGTVISCCDARGTAFCAVQIHYPFAIRYFSLQG